VGVFCLNFCDERPVGDYARFMFERFTERARQVVVLAQDEARTLKHNYIGAASTSRPKIRSTCGPVGFKWPRLLLMDPETYIPPR
jgi:hypothetical protein